MPPQNHLQDELYNKTKLSILHLISENLDNGVEKLPSEDRMAKLFGVSRVLIREVLQELEFRGYISRFKGKRAMVNFQICRAKPRIDEQIQFEEIIEAKNLSAYVRLIDEGWVDISAADLPEDAEIRSRQGPLLKIRRIIHEEHSGRPLIYNQLYFDGKNIVRNYREQEGYEALAPNEFLELFGEQACEITLSEIYVHQLEGELSELMAVPTGTALLAISDIRYSPSGHELARGLSIFSSELTPFRLIQHGR